MKAKPAPRRSPSPDPAPVRQVRHRHHPATREAILGLLDYHDQAIAFLMDPGANDHPNTDLLMADLPSGPIQGADIDYIPGKLSVIFLFELFSRVRLWTPPSAFLVLRALCLFEFSTTEPGRVRAIDKAGLPILGPGFTFMRLLADADADEEVQVVGDEEGDLWPQAFRIVRGRHLPEKRRDQAINHALRRYEAAARNSDIGEVISLEVYEALLKGAFLFDAEHGRYFLRPLAGR